MAENNHWPWWQVEVKASTTEPGKVEITLPDREIVSVGPTVAEQIADNLKRAAEEARMCARRGAMATEETAD